MNRARRAQTALQTSDDRVEQEMRWRLKQSIPWMEGIQYRSTFPECTGERLPAARGLWPTSGLLLDRKEPLSDRLSATWRYNRSRRDRALRIAGPDWRSTCRVTSGRCSATGKRFL